MSFSTNNNKGMSPALLIVGGLCCCCLCSSSVVGVLYFMVEDFKNMINGLLGLRKTNSAYAKEFADAGCKFWGASQKNNVWGCYNPTYPKRTKAVRGKVDDNPGVPGTNYKVDDIQCVATDDCLDRANKMF